MATFQAQTGGLSLTEKKMRWQRIQVTIKATLVVTILALSAGENMAQEGRLIPPSRSRGGRETGLSGADKANLILGIIDTAIRSSQPSQPNYRQPAYPNYRQPPQPVYRQPYYPEHRPQPIYTQSVTPKVTPKKNILPPKPKPTVKPVSNQASFNLLSNNVQLNDAKQRVEEHVINKTDELEGLAAADVDNLANQAKGSISDPADQQKFIEATQRGDKVTAKQLAEKHGINPSMTDSLMQAMDNEDLAIKVGDAARNGASGPELDQLLEQFAQAHQNSGGFSTIHPMQIDSLLNDVSVGSHARDAISGSLASSSNVGLPSGHCDVYTIPGLPNGCVLATADGQLIRGGESLGFQSDVPVEESLGVSVPIDEPLDDTTEAVQIESGVLLRNPKDSGGTIHYIIDGTQHSMGVGQTQKLSGKKARLITFDRGGNHGQAKYSLGEGTYVFRVTEKGWELKKQSFSVTLSNESNDNPFHYVVMGDQATIAAGDETNHRSEYPIVISFDRGDGGEPANKTLASGTYFVGLDADKKRYDLFEESAISSTTSSSIRPDEWSRSTSNRPRNAMRDSIQTSRRTRRSMRESGAPSTGTLLSIKPRKSSQSNSASETIDFPPLPPGI